MITKDHWRKPSAELVARFKEAAAGIDGLEHRQMFGMPAAFVGGNMTAGLHQDTIIVRLPGDLRQERLAAGWSMFEPMPGRPMREYVALPPGVAADADEARTWVQHAAEYVRTLPPKQVRPRK